MVIYRKFTETGERPRNWVCKFQFPIQSPSNILYSQGIFFNGAVCVDQENSVPANLFHSISEEEYEKRELEDKQGIEDDIGDGRFKSKGQHSFIYPLMHD